ncbi:MAG: dienelactone hydrolase family protein [Planctomycetota bacterium]
MNKRSLCVLGCIAASTGASSRAQVPKPTPGELHRVLWREVGVWDCTMKLFQPSQEASISKGTETTRLLAGGLWVVSDYEGELLGVPYHGHGVIGYDSARRKLVGTWVDSMSDRLSQMEGVYDAKTRTRTMWVDSIDPTTGKTRKDRHVLRYEGEDAMLFSIFVVRPGETDSKVIEVTMKRREKAMSWTGVLSEAEFARLHELRRDEAPARKGSMVRIAGSRAYLSLPPGKPPFPAVTVIHEWWGLNDHIMHWADRLAADGYAALAVDLYGGKVARESQEAMAYMRNVDGERARKILLAAHRFLAEDARVKAERRGCIGWCFGGGWSLQLALAAPDLDAGVIYYGRLVNDVEQLKRIGARILGIFGTEDRGLPPRVVRRFEKAMKEAGRDIRILSYEANHAFANPSGARYDQRAASAAWTEVRKFLAANLKR